ncbi:MAG: heparinase II/III family protein, partial [Lentisphaeria bacterium]|nr:heparinase II/III family protein [Lentisphaeria bacterium]
MERASILPSHARFAPLRLCGLALISYALFGFMGVLAAEGAAPEKDGKMVDPLLISSCDTVSDWVGGTLETSLVKQGTGAIRWVHGSSSILSLRDVPEDWSAHNTLSMRIHSAKATGSRFLIYIGSENPKAKGADYYSASITLDFEGWRTYLFPFKALGLSRSPLGWDQIDSFRFTATGWGNTPHPEAVVIIDDIHLAWMPPATGPRLTDEAFFEAMDLDLPALSKVRKAVVAGDYPAAKRAFAAHLKSRETPNWHFDWRERPRHQTRPKNVGTVAADRIVAHELTSCRITHAFGDDIDWSINPTKLKYREWTWQLSRHPFWKTLGRAYWATGDEVYAKDFVFQMTDWVTDNPVPVNSSGNRAGSRWRTIETGIRMFSSWPDSFFYFLSSPSFDDESITLMVKSMVEHAHHLMAHPSGSNNWLAMEMNGLFHVGTLFPEFRDAAIWRETASGRLYEQMNIQVYPDGAQIELATGYHGVSLHNFLGTLRLAILNEIELPGDYVGRLEKMYDYYVKLAMPDGRMPALNDAGWGSVRTPLRQGFELFPERGDFEYLATRGRSGVIPSFTSVHFPYAGWAVMRTGWAPQDLYMHFEYGPFGAAHQHEDKLSLIVSAYGKRLLTEGGVYAYDSSQWRTYVLSARAHNVIMV